MTQPNPRALAESFYAALQTRDMAVLAGYLHDDVVWTISGPVNLLSFCGPRTGKKDVMHLLQHELPSKLLGRRFITQMMLVDEGNAAILGRLTAHVPPDDHPVNYRTALFIRFSGQKVIECTSIMDSFDAAEQVLGRPLETAARSDVACVGNLVSL